MNVGRGYRLSEFMVWTRREIYVLFALGLVSRDYVKSEAAIRQLLHRHLA